MISLYNFFMIAGIIHVAIGSVMEILYWTIFKNWVWIMLIYPPPGIYTFIKIMPFMGMLFTLVGFGWLMVSFWLYLRADLDYLRKINQYSN